MSEILTLQEVGSEADQDMVRLTFRGEHPLVPYQTAFEIIAELRVASKMAMREEGNHVSLWREMSLIGRERADAIPSRRFRRSHLVPTVSEWLVQYFPGSPLVVLTFVPWPSGRILQVKIHYSDALKFYTGFRVSAREAKAWAGDSSRLWSAAAHISDGEDDYKRGFS